MPSRRNRSTAAQATDVQEDTVSTDTNTTDTEFNPNEFAGESHAEAAGLPDNRDLVEPDAAEDLDVETLPEADDEVETIPTATDGSTEGKPAKAPKPAKERARGDLPEGMVTPIGLTKAINEQGLYTNREGVVAELKPQMLYSYIKNAPKDREFPGKTVTDSVGAARDNVCTLEEGLAWWNAKNEAAAARKKNAADKAAKALEAKQKKTAAATTEGETTEAEADEPAGAVEEAE